MGRTIAQEIRTHAWTADGEPVDVVTIIAMAGMSRELLQARPDLADWSRALTALPLPLAIWRPPTGIAVPTPRAIVRAGG